MHEPGLRNTATKFMLLMGSLNRRRLASQPESRGVRLQFPTSPSSPEESCLCSSVLFFSRVLVFFFPGLTEYCLLPNQIASTFQNQETRTPLSEWLLRHWRQDVARICVLCWVTRVCHLSQAVFLTAQAVPTPLCSPVERDCAKMKCKLT